MILCDVFVLFGLFCRLNVKAGSTGEARLKSDIPGSELLATQAMSPSPLSSDEMVLREDRNFLGYISTSRLETDSNAASGHHVLCLDLTSLPA